MKLSASLVLYKNDPEIVIQAIKSLFGTPIEINLSVVDNSPTDEFKKIFDNFQEYDIDYYFNNGNNVGFGQGHNLAITRAKNYDYHLVINPDVYFDNNVITELIHYLDKHQEVGLITPKISYPNGDIQYLCKRQPTVLTLFIRRFIPKKMQFLFKKRLDWYEMRDISYNQIIEVPIISGCFMLFNRKYLDDIGYFDKNMFMYFEDYDLTLRMSKKYKTILYPHVNIYHHWARGAHNSTKLAIVFAQSAVYFFNKHGWRLY